MVGSVKIAQLLYVSFLTQPRRNLIAFNYLLTCMRELVYDLLEFLMKIKVWGLHMPQIVLLSTWCKAH